MAKNDNKSSTIKTPTSGDIFSNNSNYALFVGKNFGYYAAKWDKILQNKCGGDIAVLRKNKLNQISWNLWAFLFGIAWFAYRKMYLFSLLAILAVSLFPPVGWVMPLLFGLYGSRMYFRFVDKKLNKLEKEIKNLDTLKAEIIKAGSTSKLGFIVATALMVAAIVLTMAAKDPNFNNSLSGGDGVSYAMKSNINTIPLTLGFNKTDTVIGDIVASLAGASGKVEWKRNGNDYYIHIQRPEWAGYLKFSYNENTNYIFLSETSVNEKHCVGANNAIECLGLWLDGI